ncbi:lysozyme [Demetria terragena]|uniref:lysozyme n=1 Tax=Demetria terragena TaxID=63959 RepID=UPI00035EA4FD|nr:lysozyme [Demetria terragena]
MDITRPTLAALATALTFTFASTTSATGGTVEPHQKSEAERAGIAQEGDAFMGWNNPAEPKRSSSQTSPGRAAAASVEGIDVSKWQGNVDWKAQWGLGHRFAYVKATEGTYNKSATFAQQYNGSHDVGMIRGAYHFANPTDSSGSVQADYFVKNGGGWSSDGKTLPGVLDIEWNPYEGNDCWDMSASAMVSWIKSFTARYKTLTGRDAVIYTNTNWWKQCTGNSSAFAKNPLWIARYNSTVGTLPAGWSTYTFWQYTDTPMDQDVFNGDLTRLKALAKG